ncbi:uncharacterized protein ASCRUDRAFT_109206 [Ascoidea rubescens DSM 1968]|uniref:Uncharacterized protein n=1 Tax=Ascoidea rubescens DSM 1968 TaxID=1344418 RepID=A0A1D2VCZ4_9ASCO|nr:hypothetical protein ASCRUDRAFT_109206 [Ascoidea rubescens DSM 1968]ODV59501.1 hypothetical protein ASCRUDRAFT_109206 [Ascoidea rubescens DSM 1968]
MFEEKNSTPTDCLNLDSKNVFSGSFIPDDSQISFQSLVPSSGQNVAKNLSITDKSNGNDRNENLVDHNDADLILINQNKIYNHLNLNLAGKDSENNSLKDYSLNRLFDIYPKFLNHDCNTVSISDHNFLSFDNERIELNKLLQSDKEIFTKKYPIDNSSQNSFFLFFTFEDISAEQPKSIENSKLHQQNIIWILSKLGSPNNKLLKWFLRKFPSNQIKLILDYSTYLTDIFILQKLISLFSSANSSLNLEISFEIIVSYLVKLGANNVILENIMISEKSFEIEDYLTDINLNNFGCSNKESIKILKFSNSIESILLKFQLIIYMALNSKFSEKLFIFLLKLVTLVSMDSRVVQLQSSTVILSEILGKIIHWYFTFQIKSVDQNRIIKQEPKYLKDSLITTRYKRFFASNKITVEDSFSFYKNSSGYRFSSNSGCQNIRLKLFYDFIPLWLFSFSSNFSYVKLIVDTYNSNNNLARTDNSLFYQFKFWLFVTLINSKDVMDLGRYDYLPAINYDNLISLKEIDLKYSFLDRKFRKILLFHAIDHTKFLSSKGKKISHSRTMTELKSIFLKLYALQFLLINFYVDNNNDFMTFIISTNQLNIALNTLKLFDCDLLNNGSNHSLVLKLLQNLNKIESFFTPSYSFQLNMEIQKCETIISSMSSQIASYNFPFNHCDLKN